MQHVPLSDFFPPLLNKHSFVSSSAWKHHFTTINLFCFSFLIAPSCTQFILGSCHDKNTWNTRQRYLDKCRPIPSWHRKVLSNKCSISPQSDSLCPKQWECVSVAEGQSRRVCFMKSETMRGKFQNYRPPRHLTNENEAAREDKSLYIHITCSQIILHQYSSGWNLRNLFFTHHTKSIIH